MYKLNWLLLAAFLITACRQESAYKQLLKEPYPELYEQVFLRDADSLLTFTDHAQEHIRDQAWRALISTPISDMDAFITKVQYSNVPHAWTALSAHSLTEDQLSRVQDLWVRPSYREGISKVLGKQGNQESLNFLARNFEDIIDSEYEYAFALAIGRLMQNHTLTEVSQKTILRYAAVLKDADLFRAYFYGLYRANKSLEDPVMQQTLWESYEWTDDPMIRQYLLRILFNSNAEETFAKMDIKGMSEMNVQLAVEFVRLSEKLKWNDKLAAAYESLLGSGNPVVNVQALEQLERRTDMNPAFEEVILRDIVNNEEKEASVRLSGILALGDPTDYQSLAEQLSSASPYLLPKQLKLAQKTKDPSAFILMIEELSKSEAHLSAFYAVATLEDWWANLTDREKSELDAERLKTLLYHFMGRHDRSIAYLTLNMMQEVGWFDQKDLGKIQSYLSVYQLPEDVEVYQAAGAFFREVYPQQAGSWIDSMAAKGNFALNSTFKEQGWEVEVPEQGIINFRKPDWQRLAELEYEPVWVLETEKGTIQIEMDVLSAPATISGMDSLTRAGAYDGVAFHRVVPNFVVQGGDVESGDGFGGPDYVVPTEASHKEYRRGMVGIASAGTDTEGSQYFIMHQWAPHLNGRYTIIGNVVKGMEVVDRLMVGDRVIQAYWLPS